LTNHPTEVDVRGQITSEVHRHYLCSVYGRDGLVDTPGDTAKDLACELDTEGHAKERESDLSGISIDVGCARVRQRPHESNHQDCSSSHDFLVAVPVDEISGDLETQNLSNIRSIRH